MQRGGGRTALPVPWRRVRPGEGGAGLQNRRDLELSAPLATCALPKRRSAGRRLRQPGGPRHGADPPSRSYQDSSRPNVCANPVPCDPAPLSRGSPLPGLRPLTQTVGPKCPEPPGKRRSAGRRYAGQRRDEDAEGSGSCTETDPSNGNASGPAPALPGLARPTPAWDSTAGRPRQPGPPLPRPQGACVDRG